MILLDLPPDISFRTLSASPDDLAFSYAAKRAAMLPHVTRRWPWDETFQHTLHQRHFTAKPFAEIRKAGIAIGTLSFHIHPDHIRFGEFYLLPQHQNRGIGSAVLAHCLRVADSLTLPVRLEYLHWNPVGALYLRHGFVQVGQSDTHRFLQRAAKPSVTD